MSLARSLARPLARSLAQSIVPDTGGGVAISADTIVSFGDSIIDGTGASDTAHQWIQIVNTALGSTLLDKAISGTVLQNSNDSGGSPRTDNGRGRYSADLTGANKRELCISAYGFNDARYTAAPATFNVYQYHNDYREIVAGLLAAGYTADKIVIVAPYYITDTGLATGSAGFTGQTRAQFLLFRIAAYEVAREYGTYWYDAYTDMLNNGGASLIGVDNIHPNDSGHAVISAGVLACRQLGASTINTAPVLATSAFNVNENAAFSQQLLSSRPVSFSITGGSDQALFTISANGLLTMAAKDYESPADANTDNDYEVEVTLTDVHSNTNAVNVTVTVDNVVSENDADAQAIIDAYASTPDSTHESAINTLVLALKTGAVSSSNIFSKLDTLFVFATSEETGALVNWKDPTGTAATNVSATSFTADQGFTGDGTADYIDTNWNASTDGSNYTQNDACYFAWIRAAGSVSGISYLGHGSTNFYSYLAVNGSSGGYAAGMNEIGTTALSGTISPASDQNDLWIVQRTASNARAIYLASALVDSDTVASTALVNGTAAVLKTSAAAFGNGQVSVWGCGASLTADERTDLRNALSAFLTSVGAI